MENLFYIEDNDNMITPFGQKFKYDMDYLESAIDTYKLNVDKQLILDNFRLCYKLYGDKKRFSNYPAYVHPLSVALILIEELQISDTDIIIAALMHDIIIDIENVDIEFVRKNFSNSIANLIIEVTNISHRGKHSEIRKNKAEIYRKLFLSIIKDIRIFIIKFADRLHNLRTIKYLDENKQRDIAEDTLNFFAPFAHKLGLQKLRTELETRSFYFLNKQQYTQIISFLAEKKKRFSEYMFIFLDKVKNSLDEAGVKYYLKNIHKQVYEIFSLLQDGKKLEELDNLFSLVIVLKTDDIKECYNVYNVLANKFNSFENLDYIDNSNVDCDNSLNTKLHNINGEVEIIIRTEAMENLAEQGLVQYIVNKNSSYELLKISEEEAQLWGKWMESIIETKGNQATELIWNSIKNNIFEEGIVVYTKDKKSINLPKNATLIDFAFAISYETGLHVITGKVNNTIKDIFSKLENGDVVEIITSNKCHPESNWLNNIVSFKANYYLYDYFKNNINYKKLNISNKKNIIEKTNSNNFINVVAADRIGILNEIQDEIGRENILRTRLASCVDAFEAVFEIKSQKDENINRYFAKLFKIKGIKSVSIK